MRAMGMILAGVWAAGGAHGLAAPTPGVAPMSWEVQFSYHDPQRITLTLPGDESPSTYWYVIYTVVNETDGEVDFYPTFHVVTDELETIECGYDISPTVFDAIRTRHKKVYPFSVDPMKTYGRLLRGEDNARTSIIVFPEFDRDVDGFVLYVAGLSGEVVKILNPRFDRSAGESAENPQFFFVRKTLAVRYDIPGDSRTRLRAEPVRRDQEWVMR